MIKARVDVRKRKRIRRGLSLCLTGALLLGGCGSERNGGSRAKEQEDVVLSIFVQQSIDTDSGIWEGWAAEKLYEDTNIKLDFSATGNEVEQKLKQYIAAGTLPDIIGFRDLDQASMAMDAGLLLQLNEYRELLPAVFETPYYKNAVNYSRKYNSNETGRLYVMPCSVGPVSENAYNWMPMLQWDAYKRAGMPEINTLEDYLDAAEAMVSEKPETENGEKVYGFSLFSDWDKYSALEIAALSYFYGIDTEYVSPLMETDVTSKTTRSILHDDSFYKRALQFYFEANQRGLLDPDSITQSYSNLQRKYSDGRIMFSWFSWLTGDYNEIPSGHVEEETKPDGYVNIPAADMKIYEAPDQTIGRNWYFGISKNSKSVKKACEFLNWLYDPEIEQYLYNGPEGSIWEYGTDGEPFVTENGWKIIDEKEEGSMPLEAGGTLEEGIRPFNALGLQASTMMEDGYTISYRYWPGSRTRDITELQKEVNQFLGTDTIAEYLTEQDMVAKSTMAVNMLSTVSDNIKKKSGAVGEVVRKYSWEMVYAADTEEFQKLWSEMQTQASELGMKQIETYYQKEWEKALKKVQDYE